DARRDALGRGLPLFIIGMIAITSASAGYLYRRLRRPGDATHIIGMGASYIALLTAFYVDNGKNLPLWSHLPHLAYWLLPSLVGVPILVRALTRARNTTPGTPKAPATTPNTERRHTARLLRSAVRRGSRGGRPGSPCASPSTSARCLRAAAACRSGTRAG